MAPPIAASPIRVAIIDDDSGLVTVLDRRFSALRWEREVLGYAATPDQLAAMRLHAVIINPEITGLDYLERLAMALPGPALLVCTGTAPVADRVRGLRGGADDWVTKPCHPEELVARIQAVLRRRRVGEMPVDDSRWRPASSRSARTGSTPTWAIGRLAVAQGVRAAPAAGQRRRARAAARGDLPAGVGLHDGPRRPLGGRVRAQAPPEARAAVAGLALRAHALRGGLPIRRRAGRGKPSAPRQPRPSRRRRRRQRRSPRNRRRRRLVTRRTLRGP